ncbi:MAG: hypothetical protein ACRC2T_11725 [Thermoguttaceae bacterium]
MEIHINQTGTVSYVYNELVDLSPLGKTQIKRASYVEPDDTGKWFADLSPVQGPVLGPFFMRSEAVQAEVAYLHSHFFKENT